MPVKQKKLLHIFVRGMVQGVGFRPFIYRLAQQHSIKGWVRNTSSGVEIEAEADDETLWGFATDITAQAPPMARIEHLETTFSPPRDYTSFQILSSLAEEASYQLISPDIATCADCRKEIFTADNRRFRYPFTNCTNCGPRFTIIEDMPYDRPQTTMKRFTMCPQCRAEYEDPADRRFHAQPNACPRCGPELELVDDTGHTITCDDVIKSAARLLKEGKILAVKGLGGFQLACDATNAWAVNRLRDRKRRPAKPLAVMFATIDEVEKECLISLEERQLLQSPQCPIVLLKRRNPFRICGEVAPRLKYLGAMLPYTPLHHLILSETGLPLVMTSGNLSEEPIARDNDEALRRLTGIADYFLRHNRDIYARYDDSVYVVESGKPQAVRRARGYAPYPIILPFRSRQILACGAQEKNTFCLTRDEHAFISQHIGDMENEETLEHFENTIELYKKLFRIQPEVIAYDMHPDYPATRYALKTAEQSGLKPVPVQHHHAHIVSCMAENGITGPVIGVAFDGTGYGNDGTVWGGEFLLADGNGFHRLGHMEYVPMPGGVSAIKKPYRMALGYLFTLLGEDLLLKGLPFDDVPPVEIEIIKQELRKKLNSPLTSSAGRLFDAVSALTGVRQVIDYDAQAAVELEMQATDEYDNSVPGPYPFSIINNGDTKIVKLGGLFSVIIDEVQNRCPAGEISSRFHATMSQVIDRMCRMLSAETGIKTVALSGGVFQNRLLTRLTSATLKESGLGVITHHLVPCNDGGISLGQAVIANFIAR